MDDDELDIEDVHPHCWGDLDVGDPVGGAPATASAGTDVAPGPPRRSRGLVLFASMLPLLLLVPVLTAPA